MPYYCIIELNLLLNPIKLYITILFCVLKFLIQGQNPVIKHYSVNQGLPSSETYYVIQDSKGYLWIATDAGVVKYDGYKFITYNSSKGLPDNTVFKIHEDKYGKIWFASYSGKMAYYSYQTDSIYGIAGNSQLDKLTDFFPIDFSFDDKDTLFIAIARHGYVKLFPPMYNEFKRVTYNRNCYYVKKINKQSTIYGLNMVDDNFRAQKAPLIYEDGRNLSASISDTIYKVQVTVDHLHAIFESDTSFLFSNATEIYRLTKNRKVALNEKRGTQQVNTISIYKDKAGRFWVNGLNSGTKVFESVDSGTLIYHFLPNLSVTSVIQDTDNGYWITTLEDGLYYLPSLNLNFMDQNSGLAANKVLSIGLLNTKLSCLTSDYTINTFDIENPKIINQEKLPLSAWNLVCSNNCMLVCYNTPYIVWTALNKKVVLWIKSKENIKGNIRIKKAIDYSLNYFLGFDQGELYLINKETGECSRILSGLTKIFSVYYQNNIIWIGTKTGLYSFKNKQLLFHGDKHSILKNRVEDMLSIGDTLFLATRGYGVLIYLHDEIVRHYTENDGLASNMTKCIIKDTTGSIWIGTNRGISRLKKYNNTKYNISTLNMNSGLISNEVNQIIEHQQKLYFATNSGLGILNVTDFYNPNVSIPIYTEGFYVNNSKIVVESSHTFNYNENFIKINYKGISVKSEGDINYKYRLEGLDTNWTYTKNTFVQFTTLPPGTYRFIAYAINQDGKASNIPAIISFIIKKPFWKTWWFYAALLSIVSVIVYFIYQRRIKLIQHLEEEKTAINKRVSESELKALRAQMNPHFMFNAINSIQNFVLKNDSKSAQKYLTKFARLIRSVLENSKHDLVWLNKEVEALELYVELEALRASFCFDYEIIIEDSLNAENLFIPPMIIQPYIENAILHGIMPLSDRRGRLIIKFSKTGSVLKCIIDDNGIGRKKAKEIKERKQLSHQSMGMAVTQDRIDILNEQNNNLLTKVVVIDNVLNDIAIGTTVEITINIKNSQND